MLGDSSLALLNASCELLGLVLTHYFPKKITAHEHSNHVQDQKEVAMLSKKEKASSPTTR